MLIVYVPFLEGVNSTANIFFSLLDGFKDTCWSKPSHATSIFSLSSLTVPLQALDASRIAIIGLLGIK